MAKVYDVKHSDKRTMIYAKSIQDVRAWVLEQYSVEIGSATPEEMFRHRDSGGEWVDLESAEAVGMSVIGLSKPKVVGDE